ncbi:serine-rich adhesin for platelets-like isoform X2 [Littorina saxatilis]|uniref:serine-rich adhesin for platelets-like isoform X2 n=1 Tax=Littorina saxatilis TaxID=31220 RepID=UPI0038B67A42
MADRGEESPPGEKNLMTTPDDSSVDPEPPPVSSGTLYKTENEPAEDDQAEQDVTTSEQRDATETETERQEETTLTPPSSPVLDEGTHPKKVSVSEAAELYTRQAVWDDEEEEDLVKTSKSLFTEETYETSSFIVDGVEQSSLTKATSLYADDFGESSKSETVSKIGDDVQKTSSSASSASTSLRHADDAVTQSPTPSATAHLLVDDILKTTVTSSSSSELHTVTSSSLHTVAEESETNDSRETFVVDKEESSETMANTQVQAPVSTLGQENEEENQQAPKPSGNASCKYRWGRVVETNAQRVIFFNSAFPKDPVFLHWSPDMEAYFSGEMQVVCGDYSGHVLVEGKTYPVEGFSVRSYTFEVDLFLKDDVIEDEVANSNSQAQELKYQQQQQQGPVDTYRDITSSALTPSSKMAENAEVDDSGIHHNTKYEDLLRQQLQHKDSLNVSLENEVALSQKSDPSASGSGSKRLTPVGDIDKEPFQDGYASVSVGCGTGGFEPSHSGRSSGRHTPQNLLSGSASDLRRDYEMDRQSLKSAELNSAGDGNAGSPKLPSRPGSEYSGSQGSGRPTPQRELYENGSGSRPGSGLHTPLDTRIDDVLGVSGSRSSSTRQTPTRETIGDVLGTEAILARQTPDREVGLTGSAHSSARSTPQREPLSTTLRASPDRLYSSQELASATEQRLQSGSRPASQQGSVSGSRPGSVTGSRPGSRQGSQLSSRTQSLNSLTSEQELSQFFETNPQAARDPVRTPVNFDTHPDESATLPPIMRDRDRPASLPHYSTQSPVSVDKRTFTPDRPWATSATPGAGLVESSFQQDLFTRPSKSSASSRASSRTITPVPTGVDKEDSEKVRDLEDTVATLRKLLSSREQEVHELTAQMRDLKDINHSLKKDLEHARSRRTPTPGSEDMERQYQQLLQEKNFLAGEVVKLRDQLETLRGTGVDSFAKNSSTVMQKRIEELESHIRDIRHSSDSAAKKFMRAELRIKELTEENDKLRSTATLHVQDLQDERGVRYSDRRLQIEIQQLREDVLTLRDRNYTLQEDNLKLKEGRETRAVDFRSRELLKDLPGRASLSSSLRSDDGILQRSESSHLRESNLQTTDRHHSKHLPPSDQLTSPRQQSALRSRHHDRSFGSDGYSAAPSKDPLQRPHDRPHFGSDHGARDSLRETSSYSRSRLENTDKEHSSDRHVKYEYGSERASDLRRTDPGRYDLLRSRPDGEVSEKLLATDAEKYGTLSTEKLRSFDRERGPMRGDTKLTMSAERLRILEEAERNRERRGLAAVNTGSMRAASADNIMSSKGDPRQRKAEGNHSDDSDSTAILMSYDAKADIFSGQRDKEKISYRDQEKISFRDQEKTYRDQEKTYRDQEKTYRDQEKTYRDQEKSSYRDQEKSSYKDQERSSYRDQEKSSYKDQERSSYSRPQDGYYDRRYLQEKEQAKRQHRDYRDLPGLYREANGEDSDTATDILLNAEPGRSSNGHSHSRHRHRRSSVGDDTSLSSPSDVEDPQDSRRRSKSVDAKGKKRTSQSGILRTAASTDMLGGGKTVTLAPGLRSVTPQPMATQHNRNAIIQQQAALSSSLTQGLRPFAPRSPGDVRIDDVVKFSRQGGKLSQGTVKYVGHLPGRSDVYLGVELYKEEGKHDGTFEDVRYFKCKPSKGVFVAFNKVVMAWAPN